MPAFDFAALRRPVSDAQPCGPDLELAGDADYMNFVVRAEGLLPTTFFSGPDGKPFDRASIDFDAEFAKVEAFVDRTRDVRLLAILAKLLMLARDLAGFVACVDLVAALLDERWDEVHPQAVEDDCAVRMAALESLDDMPPVVFPLQYLPLINDRRLGPVSYRTWLVATGGAKPREGEEVLAPAVIESALMDAPLDHIVAIRDLFRTLQAAIARIRHVCVERVGAERAAKFERLPDLVATIAELIDRIVTRRDPTLGSGKDAAGATPNGGESAAGAAPPGPSPKLASTQDVAAALAAIVNYFSRFEPSNPALLLVRQAEQLMGKSFLEAMRVLMPDHMDQAAIQIGRDQRFDLPIERLSAFADLPEIQYSDVAATITETSGVRLINAKDRAEAMRLLEQVDAYYRTAEPSSPIPFLTERARSLAERDFLSLLKEFLPESALRGIGEP